MDGKVKWITLRSLTSNSTFRLNFENYQSDFNQTCFNRWPEKYYLIPNRGVTCNKFLKTVISCQELYFAIF